MALHPAQALGALLLLAPAARAQTDPPSRDEVGAALHRAVTFLHRQVAVGGGYVWKVSGDLRHRMGEGPVHETRIWVQPPGTPTVGEALLDVHEASGDPAALRAAVDAARALVHGQLESGGWAYFIETDRDDPGHHRYRWRRGFGPAPEFHGDRADGSPQGWRLWRERTRGNVSTLDDDTTQAATRFLMRVDAVLDFEDERIHDAATYALAALRAAQYPCGGWSHNFDRFPDRPPDPAVYPVLEASFPEDWPREWPNTWEGCYVLNDDLVRDAVDTLLLAAEVYDDERCFEAAVRAGDFLIRAQLPDPQPGWAQQYDRHMQPTWARRFEPPAVTGGESHGALRTLLALHRRTGEPRFLAPVPRALDYFAASELPGGRLARFYELGTNRPLYCERGSYELTHDDDDLPGHYAFVVDSAMDAIRREYERLEGGAPAPSPDPPAREVRARRAARVLAAMDERGAWTEPGVIRDDRGRKVRPEAGVIDSRTTVANLRVLCRFLAAH